MKDKLTTLDKNELEGELNMLTREIVEIARQIEYIKKTIGINKKGEICIQTRKNYQF